MQPVSITCHKDRTRVVLKGALDVSAAVSAYGPLDQALARGLPLQLQAGELERADAGGLQLLLLFVTGARARGMALTWRSVSAALATSAELLGLTSALKLPR